MADPIIAALPVRTEVAIGLPAVAETVAVLPSSGIVATLPNVTEVIVSRPVVPVLVMPSGTVAMLPVRFGVQFTAVGTFVVEAVAVHVAAVQFAADADLESLAFEVQSRAAEFTGEGTFVASDIPRRFVEFTGVGSLATVGVPVFKAAVGFSAIGTLVFPTAMQVQARATQFAGTGSLSASSVQIESRSVQFTGTGTLGASAMRVYSAAVEFSGVGNLGATGQIGEITYIGATTGGGTIVSSFTCAMPTGFTAGDVLVFVVRGFLAAMSGTPAGWTQQVINTSRSSTSPLYLFTKIADGTETGVTASFTSANSHYGQVLAFRGVSQTNPIGASTTAYRSTSSSSNVSPTITPTNPKSYVLRALATGQTSSGSTFTWPAGQTEHTDGFVGTGTNWDHITVGGALVPTAAATGTVTVTSSTSMPYALSIVVALNPAGVA